MKISYGMILAAGVFALVPKQAHNQMANGRFPTIKLEA